MSSITCPIPTCIYESTNIQSVRAHAKQRVHYSSPKFSEICHICSRDFKSRSKTLQHVRTVHCTGRFKCDCGGADVAGLVFDSPSSLQRHLDASPQCRKCFADGCDQFFYSIDAKFNHERACDKANGAKSPSMYFVNGDEAYDVFSKYLDTIGIFFVEPEEAEVKEVEKEEREEEAAAAAARAAADAEKTTSKKKKKTKAATSTTTAAAATTMATMTTTTDAKKKKKRKRKSNAAADTVAASSASIDLSGARDHTLAVESMLETVQIFSASSESQRVQQRLLLMHQKARDVAADLTNLLLSKKNT